MATTTASVLVRAPADAVFRTVSDIRNFQEAIPHIVKVEFLTDQQVGVGTRFAETRLMNGREATVELEVTEFVENERVRIVSDSHGCVWDSVFTVSEDGDQTRLALEMEGRPYTFMARVMNMFIGGMLRKALQADMDAVKAHCESGGGAAPQASPPNPRDPSSLAETAETEVPRDETAG